MQLPEKGTEKEALFKQIHEMRADDADWRGGRTFSLVYPASQEVDEVLEEASNLFLFENALNPFKFPSHRRMESEVVDMTASMLNAPSGSGGSMTSGGTESIIMSVKTARDRAAAERGITEPEMVIPHSAHPAFSKAAHYLKIQVKQAPLRDDLRCDVDAARELVTDKTVLMVGSAPNYPHGVIDPISDLASIAAENNASFHTDSCLGGFMLPFWERLGADIPPFDFRVEGVTAMSADVHKYGYTPKGASVVLHRDGSHVQYQAFLYDEWPGGLYGSYAMAGARPAHPIAAAWAIMNSLGYEGYTELAKIVRDTTQKLKDGISSIDGLFIHGEPDMSVFSFGADGFDVMAVGDQMDDRGWHLDRQNRPDALHLMVSPIHANVADSFLADLAESVEQAGASRGVEARYS